MKKDEGGYLTAEVLAADKLVLPGEASDYYVNAVSLHPNAAVNETLQVYNPANNSSIFVAGQFGEVYNYTSLYSMHGQIEQLVFADGTFATDSVQAHSVQAQSLDGGARTTTTTSSSVTRRRRWRRSRRAPTPRLLSPFR